jgi:hypothetical protein
MTAIHPRDALIEFDAGPHKYTCMGQADYMSVTTWNHTHFPQFDADAIIRKMKLTNPTCKYYGQTPDQIKAGWDKNRDEAAQLGTEMHAVIEQYWLGLGGVGGYPPNFRAFVAAHPDIKPYRAEWMIFDQDVRLAGSIDFVAENPDGSLTIYDWKRCKEIKKTNSYGVFAITECIAHLPDTNYWHYALQLNTYKTILERKYDKKVKAMILVGLHPNLPTYRLYTVPDLASEMAELFAQRTMSISI